MNPVLPTVRGPSAGSPDVSTQELCDYVEKQVIEPDADTPSVGPESHTITCASSPKPVATGATVSISRKEQKKLSKQREEKYTPPTRVSFSGLPAKGKPLMECHDELTIYGDHFKDPAAVHVQARGVGFDYEGMFNCITWAAYCASDDSEPQASENPEERVEDAVEQLMNLSGGGWERIDESDRDSAECALLATSAEWGTTHAMVLHPGYGDGPLWQSKMGPLGPIVLHPRSGLDEEQYGTEVAWFKKKPKEVKPDPAATKGRSQGKKGARNDRGRK